MPIAPWQRGIVTARPGAVPRAVAKQKGSLLVSVESIEGTATAKAPDGTVETV